MAEETVEYELGFYQASMTAEIAPQGDESNAVRTGLSVSQDVTGRVAFDVTTGETGKHRIEYKNSGGTVVGWAWCDLLGVAGTIEAADNLNALTNASNVDAADDIAIVRGSRMPRS